VKCEVVQNSAMEPVTDVFHWFLNLPRVFNYSPGDSEGRSGHVVGSAPF
jgi:hypothetical protein